MDLSKYTFKDVRIIDKSGTIHTGHVDLYIPDKDNDIFEDCIGLDTGTGFYASDIKSIEILSE